MDTCIHHSPKTVTILIIGYILIENKKVQINREKKKREKTRMQLLKKKPLPIFTFQASYK